mmetsp:Transcript_86114/g.278653  ORF Transcript_86114/g.278653 Transcript_86114/m.278653 type:complete len:251 (-) Transcript_86114:1140-1892(-)
MAAISVRGSSNAQFFSCMLCVVATTRAPRSRNASRIARASAAPCMGSVPVPASSTMTSAWEPESAERPSMIREATRCAEYVERSSTIVCMSPTSATTTSKKSTRGDSPVGTGMPQRASRAKRPAVLSTTVLPPAFGPLRMRPCGLWLSSSGLPTTLVPPRRIKQGFLACCTEITPSSLTSGTSPSMSSPRKSRARPRSMRPAASRQALMASLDRETATHIRPRMRRTRNFSSFCSSVSSLVRATSSCGSV